MLFKAAFDLAILTWEILTIIIKKARTRSIKARNSATLLFTCSSWSSRGSSNSFCKGNRSYLKQAKYVFVSKIDMFLLVVFRKRNCLSILVLESLLLEIFIDIRYLHKSKKKQKEPKTIFFLLFRNWTALPMHWLIEFWKQKFSKKMFFATINFSNVLIIKKVFITYLQKS